MGAYNMKLPFPWANFRITEEELSRIEELEDEERISVRTAFFNSVLDDTDDEFSNLINDYKAADAGIRSVIDATLVRVCGWSLPSLCRMAEEAACSEDFPRKEQEGVLGEMLGYLAEFSTFDAGKAFGIEEDSDLSDWPPLKLQDTLCEVGAYLRDLWASNQTDSEIREKFLEMGVPEGSGYLEDFDFNVEGGAA